MKQIGIFFFFFLFLCSSSFSQVAPKIQWQKCIGGSGEEDLYPDYAFAGITKTQVLSKDKKNLFIAFSTTSKDGDVGTTIGTQDVFVAKLDLLGNIIWKTTIDGYGNDDVRSLTETSDGSLLLSGSSSWYPQGTTGPLLMDAFIVKMNNNGTISWKKYFGGTENDVAVRIIETKDGNYAFIGFSESSDGHLNGSIKDDEIWLGKINKTGGLLWNKKIGKPRSLQFDYGIALQEDSEGNFVIGANVGGYLDSNTATKDVFVAKINSFGTEIWRKFFTGSENDYLYDIKIADANRIILAGTTLSSNGDFGQKIWAQDGFVIFLDSSGNTTTVNRLGGTDNDGIYDLAILPDNSVLAAGISKSTDGHLTGNTTRDSDAWIFKFSQEGKILWSRTYGGSGVEAAHSIGYLNENEFIFFGQTRSNDFDVSGNHGNRDVWLVKIGNDSLANCTLKPKFTTLGDSIAPASINFINQTTPDLTGTSYKWYFGTFDSSTSKNPTYTFTTPGSYKITLVASLNANCKQIYDSTIVIKKKDPCLVKADFSVPPTIHATTSFSLTNSSTEATSYLWSFGNGQTSTLTNPSHSYSAPGVYSLKLIATGANNCKDSVIKNITVVAKPESCTLTPKFTVAGNMTAAASINFINQTVPDSSSVSYKWYFGNMDSSSLKNPNYTFNTPGTYNVKLRASLSTTCQKLYDTTIVIKSNDSCTLKAGFTFPDTIRATVAFSFLNSSSVATSYLWSFGDGRSSTQANPTHSYNLQGSYNVKLVVRNANCADSVTRNVLVKPKTDDCTFIPQFSYVNNPSNPLSVVFFNNSLTATATTWRWDFGDSTTSTEREPIHDFKKEGNYKVCLLVKDAFCERTHCDTVSAVTATTEPISVFPNPAINSLSVKFHLAVEDEVDFLFYNDAGRLVKRVHKKFGTGLHVMEIGISDLNPGIYFLRLYTPKNLGYSIRFIKL